jgi:hypothetical protein
MFAHVRRLDILQQKSLEINWTLSLDGGATQEKSPLGLIKSGLLRFERNMISTIGLG